MKMIKVAFKIRKVTDRGGIMDEEKISNQLSGMGGENINITSKDGIFLVTAKVPSCSLEMDTAGGLWSRISGELEISE